MMQNLGGAPDVLLHQVIMSRRKKSESLSFLWLQPCGEASHMPLTLSGNGGAWPAELGA